MEKLPFKRKNRNSSLRLITQPADPSSLEGVISEGLNAIPELSKTIDERRENL